ncbi:hypothetical protein CYMTET_51903 [Cymbomonas tetramitiformis]|uniref:Uncharacterized protein n=1 Tax=Cymbomonas tetramitiformis TaxID=36881 RepID=A0AAE0BLX2_9CHLO|nr:hypothetical protein CYMTET_51903 [Cymbomonas tetramitiformis]
MVEVPAPDDSTAISEEAWFSFFVLPLAAFTACAVPGLGMMYYRYTKESKAAHMSPTSDKEQETTVAVLGLQGHIEASPAHTVGSKVHPVQ